MDKFKRYNQKLQKYFRVAGKWRWNNRNFEAEVWSRFWSWVLVIIGITFCDITWKQLLWWKHPTLWLCLWQCFIKRLLSAFTIHINMLNVCHIWRKQLQGLRSWRGVGLLSSFWYITLPRFQRIGNEKSRGNNEMQNKKEEVRLYFLAFDSSLYQGFKE